MMNYNQQFWAGGMMGGTPGFIQALGPLLLLLLAWTFFWKGLALWHAGRRDQAVWFIVLLLVNTLGILEIVYLFAVLKLKMHELFTKK